MVLLCSSCVTAQKAFAQENTSAMNIANNPGFEDGTCGWYIAGDTATVVNDVAHSGTHSLHYTNTDAARYNMFIQQLVDVQPGQRLVFSAWVKGRGITSEKAKDGAGIYVESSDAAGKYADGAYPTTIPGTYDWQQVKGEYTLPPNAAKTSVGIYLRKGATGEVWFDDVQVRVVQPAPVVSLLLYPNYRGIIKQGDTAPWKSFLRINAAPDWKTDPIKIQYVLSNAAGKVLITVNRQVAGSDKTANVTFPAPTNLPLGDYTLKQTVTDPNGQVALEQQCPIHVVQEMPKVYIDAQGFTVANGKRFFPLGIYSGIPRDTDTDLQRISQGGFNTVLSYTYGTGPDPQAYMDRAAKNNLKVVYSVKDLYHGLGKAPVDSLEKAAGFVRLLRNNDDLLAWYTNDEMGPEWLPQLKQMYDQVVELDPNHPTFHVLTRMPVIERYFNTTDIFGPDPYPVDKDYTNLTKTSEQTRIVAAAAHGVKGLWVVPQVMDYAVYHQADPSEAPTKDQMRNQAYQAIINGAKGLIFYSYFDLFFNDAHRVSNQAAFDKRWPDVTAMAQEIKALIPAILNGQKVDLALPQEARVEASALKYQNEVLILLANPYYHEEKITFALPEGWKITQAEQGDIKSTFANGQVTFTLPSAASGVFRLKKL